MLRRLFAGVPAEVTEDRAQATTWGTWPGDIVTTSTWSGAAVSAESSLQLLTVYGCVRLICDGISTLPIDVFRKTPTGEKQEVSKPSWLLNPTTDLDFTSWCTQVLSSLLLHGNAYVWVTRSGSSIVELIPLDPSRVMVTRSAGRVVYVVNGVPFDGEIIHVKGLMMPGQHLGVSPVEAARQSIGLGISAQQFGAQFFDGDGNMPGVIEAPTKMQPDTMRQIADAWQRKRNKRNKGLPGVLDQGATWKPTGVTNEQAQFLATRQFTASEIAGQMFLVDPSELGIPVAGSSLTYANLEQRSVRKVQVTFLPWIIRIEKMISDLLAQPRYMRFNIEGLLRGDTLSRYQSYQIGIGTGFLLPEEARDFEDLPPLPGAPIPPGEEPNGTPNA